MHLLSHWTKEHSLIRDGLLQRRKDMKGGRDYSVKYGWLQSLDHEIGKLRCMKATAAGSDQTTECSSSDATRRQTLILFQAHRFLCTRGA